MKQWNSLAHVQNWYRYKAKIDRYAFISKTTEFIGSHSNYNPFPVEFLNLTLNWGISRSIWSYLKIYYMNFVAKYIVSMSRNLGILYENIDSFNKFLNLTCGPFYNWTKTIRIPVQK